MGREGNPLFYPAGRSGASAGGAVRQRLAAQLELAAARLVAAFADSVLHLPALPIGCKRIAVADCLDVGARNAALEHQLRRLRHGQRIGHAPVGAGVDDQSSARIDAQAF